MSFYILDKMNIIGFIILTLKPLISINTGIYYEGIVNLQRDRIIENYLKNDFWRDLLCILALVIENKVTSLVFLLQISWIKTYQTTIDINFQISVKFPILIKLAKLMILILSVAHLFACGFLFINIYDQDKQNSWLISSDIQDSQWEIKYLNSIYFMVITMSTIGYGDISPVTVAEKIYGIIISFLACGVFAFAVNMIGTVFQEKAQRLTEYNNKKQYALKFMKVRNISKYSQTKVLKFMEYEFNLQDKEGNLEQGQQVLNQISKNIREEVYKEFYEPIIKREIIYKEGSLDSNLYYVNKGTVEIYEVQQDKSQKVKGYIETGQFFGYESFFQQGYNKSENVRSQNFSQVIYIQQQDLLKLIDQFPLQLQNFKLVQEKLQQLKGNLSQCLFCQNKQHNTQYCPLVHYIPYQEKVMQQYFQTFNIKQIKRKRYYRREQNKTDLKCSALKGLYIYRTDGLCLRRDLVQENQEYKNLTQIYDKAYEFDDEQFTMLTPNIQFVQDTGYKIQNLKQFLEQVQNYEIDNKQMVEISELNDESSSDSTITSSSSDQQQSIKISDNSDSSQTQNGDTNNISNNNNDNNMSQNQRSINHTGAILNKINKFNTIRSEILSSVSSIEQENKIEKVNKINKLKQIQTYQNKNVDQSDFSSQLNNQSQQSQTFQSSQQNINYKRKIIQKKSCVGGYNYQQQLRHKQMFQKKTMIGGLPINENQNKTNFSNSIYNILHKKKNKNQQQNIQGFQRNNQENKQKSLVFNKQIEEKNKLGDQQLPLKIFKKRGSKKSILEYKNSILSCRNSMQNDTLGFLNRNSVQKGQQNNENCGFLGEILLEYTIQEKMKQLMYIIPDFDVCQQYYIYRPWNNFDTVLTKFIKSVRNKKNQVSINQQMIEKNIQMCQLSQKIQKSNNKLK